MIPKTSHEVFLNGGTNITRIMTLDSSFFVVVLFGLLLPPSPSPPFPACCAPEICFLNHPAPAAGMYTEARFADVTCSGHKRFSCPPLTTASPVANATTVTNAVNTTTVTNAVNTTMAIATTASSPSAVVGDDTQSSGSQESSATVSSPTVATSKGGLDMNLILYIVVPVAGALLLGGLLLLVVCIVQRKRKDTMDVSDKQVQVKTTVKNATVKVTNSLWIDVDK